MVRRSATVKAFPETYITNLWEGVWYYLKTVIVTKETLLME